MNQQVEKDQNPMPLLVTVMIAIITAFLGSLVGYSEGKRAARQECHAGNVKAADQRIASARKESTPEEDARKAFIYRNRYEAEMHKLDEPKRRKECEMKERDSLLSEYAFRKSDDGSMECMRRSRCTSDGKYCGEWVRW